MGNTIMDDDGFACLECMYRKELKMLSLFPARARTVKRIGCTKCEAERQKRMKPRAPQSKEPFGCEIREIHSLEKHVAPAFYSKVSRVR